MITFVCKCGDTAECGSHLTNAFFLFQTNL